MGLLGISGDWKGQSQAAAIISVALSSYFNYSNKIKSSNKKNLVLFYDFDHEYKVSTPYGTLNQNKKNQNQSQQYNKMYNFNGIIQAPATVLFSVNLKKKTYMRIWSKGRI